MKRKFVVFTVILLILSNLVSCKREGGMKNELGIHFNVLDDMTEKSVPYADIFYSNAEVEIFINVFSREELDDPEGLDLSENITVEDYTKIFISNNGYKTEYYYDTSKNKALFDIEVKQEDYSAYCMFLITRSEAYLYVVGMECPLELYETYAPTFSKWAEEIYVDDLKS